VKKLLSLIFVLGMVSGNFAQDAEFTQFNSVPLYINPAFAGAGKGIHRFAAAYRNQWPGFDRHYTTYMASYDASIVKYNTGAGLYFIQDQAGSSYLTNTQIGLDAAYSFALNVKWNIRGGLQACYNQKRFQQNRLVFNDQLITSSATTETFATNSVQFFDVGAGLLLESKLMYFGISARHLNQPDQSMVGKGASSELPMLISAQGSYRYEIVKPENIDDESPHTIGGLLHYRHQGINDQLDLGVSYFYKLINFTVWYRGIPFKTYSKNFGNSESVAFLLAYQPLDKPFTIGYSYDYTISSLSSRTTAGAHEITISHTIGSKGRVVRKSRKAIGGSMKF